MRNLRFQGPVHASAHYGAPLFPQVTVRNLRFQGPVRVVVTHLSAEDPGFGAILFSLPTPPEVGLDVRIAGGEVTRGAILMTSDDL